MSGAPWRNGERRRMFRAGLLLAVAIVLVYVALPAIAGLDDTWNRMSAGDPWWLLPAALLELASYAGYVVLFRAVFARADSPIGWRESYQITMAAVAATRLLAAGGAGGLALTGWALRNSGLDARTLTVRLSAFLVLLYSVFMGSLLLVGVALRAGLLPGPDPFGMTVVPALFGGGVIVAALALTLFRSGRVAVLGDGVREAVRLLRTRDWRLAGAPAWWAFDVAVLYACLGAFGASPPIPVVIMAYFTGMLGNLLPLPGGVGGVDGGMVAGLAAFGVPAGTALVAVLAYRAFAFWLPTIPGAIAYWQLRHTVGDWRRSTALRRGRRVRTATEQDGSSSRMSTPAHRA